MAIGAVELVAPFQSANPAGKDIPSKNFGAPVDSSNFKLILAAGANIGTMSKTKHDSRIFPLRTEIICANISAVRTE